MVLAWKDVVANPEYQGMSSQDKIKAQVQYFDEVVAPQLPAESTRLEARKEFFTQHPPTDYLQEEIDKMSTYEKTMAGIGRGMLDTAQGAKQMALQAGEKLGLVSPETVSEYEAGVEQDIDYFQKLAEQSTAASLGRVGGQIAATAPIPGGVAGGVLKRAGTAGLAGAAAAGVQFTPEEESRLKNIALGGGVAAPTSLALSAGGKVLSALSRKKGAIADKGAEELVGLAEKHGVPASYGDITGGPIIQKVETQLESVPVVGMGGFRAKGAKEAQRAARMLRDEFEPGGDDWTATLTGSLKNKAGTMRKIAGKKYSKVSSLTDPLGAVPTTKMNKTASDLLAKETAKKPKYQDVALIKILKKYATDPDYNFSGLRDLRSDIGDDISDYYKGVNAVVGKKGVSHLQSMKNALELDMSDFAEKQGGDISKAWKEADAFYKGHVVPFRDRNIAKAMTTDELDTVYGMFIQRGKGDRAKKFYKALDSRGKDAVRYGMIDEAYHAAMKGDAFSPAAFRTYMKNHEKATGVFFKGENKKLIDGFTKLMGAVKRHGQYMENPPTGNRLAPYILALGAATLSPEATLTAGGTSLILKKMFTNKGARKLLLASSRLRDGSPKIKKMLEEGLVGEFISPAMQAPKAVGLAAVEGSRD